MPVGNDAGAVSGEALYNARASTPGYGEIFKRWALHSALCREQAICGQSCRLDVEYGSHPMEKLDLFLPQGRATSTLMYIHGGYWSSLDKADASLVAPAFVEAGHAVAVINYALYPLASLGMIANQVRAAAVWLHRHCGQWHAESDNLYACGHSAGGHLASLLLATNWRQFDQSLPSKLLAGAISISGLYDLTPLLSVPSIVALRQLEHDEAVRLSPAFLTPNAPLLTAVGSNENQGFHDQAAIIAKRWRGVHAGQINCEGRDHFTILDELIRSDGKIFAAALRLMTSNTS